LRTTKLFKEPRLLEQGNKVKTEEYFVNVQKARTVWGYNLKSEYVSEKLNTTIQR